MSGWTPGGANEPAGERQKREARLSDVPARDVPRSWLIAARWWLDDGNAAHESTLAALFQDTELRDHRHWHQILARAVHHQRRELERSRWHTVREVRAGLRSLMPILAGKGGWLPVTTPGELRSDRRRIVKAARNLAAALGRDPYASDASVAQLLKAAGMDTRTSDHHVVWALVGTRATDGLRGLADAVEAGASLDIFGRDTMIRQGRISTRRDDMQQVRQFGVLLAEQMQVLTGSRCSSFVAAAGNHVFGRSDTREDVRNRLKQ